MQKKTMIGLAVIVVVVVAAAGIYLYMGSTATPAKTYKAAILLSASIDSVGFPEAGYRAMLDVGEEYGIETAYTEWVDPAAAVGIAVDYIEAGYNIIITHGGQYVTACEEIAQSYPDVTVVAHANSTMDYSNIYSVIRDDDLPYYAVGFEMAHASATGKIGFVGGLEFPTAIGVINLVYMGAQTVNPDIEMYYAHTGDFDAPVPNSQAVEAQIAEGVDVIVPWLGGTGILASLEAAKAAPRTTYLIGTGTDMSEIDPLFMTSIVFDLSGLYSDIVGNVINNGETSGTYRMAEYCTLASTNGILSSAIEQEAAQLNTDVISGAAGIERVTDHYLMTK